MRYLAINARCEAAMVYVVGGRLSRAAALCREALDGVGEPLLNRDLPAMIAYLKSRDDPPHILFNSNAILLTAGFWAAVLYL